MRVRVMYSRKIKHYNHIFKDTVDNVVNLRILAHFLYKMHIFTTAYLA